MSREDFELLSFNYKKRCSNQNNSECNKRAIYAFEFLKSLGLISEMATSQGMGHPTDLRYRESELDKSSRVVICCMLDKKLITDVSGVIYTPGA